MTHDAHPDEKIIDVESQSLRFKIKMINNECETLPIKVSFDLKMFEMFEEIDGCNVCSFILDAGEIKLTGVSSFNTFIFKASFTLELPLILPFMTIFSGFLLALKLAFIFIVVGTSPI